MPGVLVSQSVALKGNTPTVICSAQSGPWVTIHDDLEATAATSEELIRPLSVMSANVHAVRLPPSAKHVMLRARWTAAGAVTTSPVLRVYGVFGSANDAGWFDDDGTVHVIRLDRYGNSSGQTLTLDAANDLRDTKYSYSAPLLHADTALPYLNCLGSSYVFALVQTAANVAGAQACVLQAAFTSG